MSPDGGVAVEGITRNFGSVRALDGAVLHARRGEVHAVLGENGAGKTTLLSILAGLVHPDAGSIRVDGREVSLTSPRAAWALGIGMVHQHFALVPRMTVLENLALGRRDSAHGFKLDLDGLAERARTLAASTGLEVPLDAPVESLGVAERQRAEILKVLLRDPGILILDEPTAVLAPAEIDRLLALLRRLAAGGRAVLLVAHKLDEVLGVADRVTVLRAGRTVLEAPRAEVDAQRLALAMVGGAPGAALSATPSDASSPAGAPVARLVDVHVPPSRTGSGLDRVSLEVRRGEIVGVAGVEGNGQRELARVLARRQVPTSGVVEGPADPAYIPQDRTTEGLIGDFPVTANLALRLRRDPSFRRGAFLRWGAVRDEARALIGAYAIRTPDAATPVQQLSGGNRQRVVIARELHGHPGLIVAENPTRGLDVAAAAFVHAQLRACAHGQTGDRPASVQPAGVVLVSTDLDEVLALADRIVVLVRGRLVEVPAAERTREGVGRRMVSGMDAAQGAP